ncbi:MAG: ABC transporter permease [Firmicutes bacterium]|nr:ABC transporter permease [Bacillota bacterium]
MSKFGVLVSRDFTSRVRGAAYIVGTLVGILVLIGLVFGPSLIEKLGQSFERVHLDVYVLDRTGVTYPLLVDVAAGMGNGTKVTTELLPSDALPAVDDPDFGKKAAEILRDSERAGVLVIDEAPELGYSPVAFTLVLQDATNVILNEAAQNVLNSVVRRANAEKLNMTAEELSLLWASAPLSIQQLKDVPGEEASTEEVSQSSHMQSMVLAYFLLFILYLAMILYGNMIATGVAEEKSSRIMEIMVSSVRPIELMAAKIAGIGALGLLQFGIWIAAGLSLNALAKSGILTGTVFGVVQLSELPVSTLVWFGVFFVLGFVLYAAVFAAAGASVSRVEDVNQVSTMIMMVVMVAFFVAYYSFINPNSTLAVICSMIPWLAPMVMFSRLALSDPPAVQVVISLALLVVGSIFTTWVAARIYRIGVLMYGKRPSLKDIARYVLEP